MGSIAQIFATISQPMNFILYLLIILNFLWSIYLTFLLYRKNIKGTKNADSSKDNNLKVNIIRFNPFNDLGGEQSFTLTILDKNNSGALLTSLHNRDITRLYAKSIKNGKGDNITLSKEEKLAIVKTIKG
jgi:Protein of unknown function (DUF4446)